MTPEELEAKRQELKAKHNIPNDDFLLLTERPSDKDIQEKGALFKIGEALGVQEWMWKSPLGIVLAIILVPVVVLDAYNFWQPKLVYGAEQLLAYVETYEPPPPQEQPRWIAFYPQNMQPPPSNQPPTTNQLPIGTGLFPVSGKAPFA